MQHQIEKYIGEGRFAMARNLIVTLPPEMHSAWHAAVDIISYAKEDPLKALALDGEGGMLNDATVRKAFKLRSVLVHPDKFSSCIAERAFRQLSLAYEDTLHSIQAGGKPSTTLASETVPGQFAWWEPWDKHHQQTCAKSPSERRCSCAAKAARSHQSDAPQAQARHLDSEAEPSSGGPGIGATQQPTSDKNAAVHLSAPDACTDGNLEAQRPGATEHPSSGPNKRARVDDSEMVADAAADLVWLRGLTLADLAVEVKWRQNYVMNALASRQSACASTTVPVEAEDEIKTHHAAENGSHSTSIGGVSIEDLGLRELRASLDRSRSCLASRSQEERKVGAALGGFF